MSSDQGEVLDAGFLAAIIDNVAHPVFVKDRQFRFVFLNQALCQMVGYPRAQMLGKTDYDFFPKAEADFFRKKDSELFGTAHQVVIDEEQITDAAGARHVLATTKVPLRNPGGVVTHLVGIIHDITLLKTAQEALKAANEELERRVAERTRELADAQQELLRKERLAVLGRLVGGLAHQIRNPLAALDNAAFLLNRTVGADPDSDTAQALSVIHQEVTRANQIIVDLLDYARVRAPAPMPLPIEALVNEVLSHDVPERITVQRELAASLTAIADHDQVEGALRNLVRNAFEAMPGGGTLRVASRREGQQLLISIGDTGPGLSPEVRAHLFEPLVTTKPLGLGLGLTTARSLIENQHGTLVCSQSDAHGTRFDVRLPAAP